MNKYLYHGSSQKFDILKCFPSSILNNEKVVFATPNYINSVIFSASWTDYDFDFGKIDKYYLIEKYPGAFDILKNKFGYIHYLNKSDFQNDKRLPPNELISHKDVKPMKIEKVNIFKKIEKSQIQLITFEEFYKKLLINKPIKMKIKFNILYVPLTLEAKNLNKKFKFFYYYEDIKDINENDNIMVDNIDYIRCQFVEFDCKKIVILFPGKNFSLEQKNKKYNLENFKKYLEAKEKIYKL